MFKGGGAAVEAARWKTARPGADPGVREYRPRRVGSSAEPEAPAPAPPEAVPGAAPPPAAEPAVDLDAVRREAFQEGFEAGEQSGARGAEQAAARRLEQLQGIVDELVGYKTMLRLAAARETVELAFAVARRVVRRELTLDPGMTLAMVKACLEEYPGVDIRRVRVHPDAAAAVREALGGKIEIAADAEVAAGGAVLETSQGRLDARIETQLEEIERGLADR